MLLLSEENSFLKTFGKPLSHLTEEKPCLLEGLIPGDRKTVRMVLSYRFLCWHERLTPVICSNVFFHSLATFICGEGSFFVKTNNTFLLSTHLWVNIYYSLVSYFLFANLVF